VLLYLDWIDPAFDAGPIYDQPKPQDYEWRGEGRYGSSTFLYNFSIKTMCDSTGTFKAAVCASGKILTDPGRIVIPAPAAGGSPTVATTLATLRPYFA